MSTNDTWHGFIIFILSPVYMFMLHFIFFLCKFNIFTILVTRQTIEKLSENEKTCPLSMCSYKRTYESVTPFFYKARSSRNFVSFGILRKQMSFEVLTLPSEILLYIFLRMLL